MKHFTTDEIIIATKLDNKCKSLLMEMRKIYHTYSEVIQENGVSISDPFFLIYIDKEPIRVPTKILKKLAEWMNAETKWCDFIK